MEFVGLQSLVVYLSSKCRFYLTGWGALAECDESLVSLSAPACPPSFAFAPSYIAKPAEFVKDRRTCFAAYGAPDPSAWADGAPSVATSGAA